MASGWRELPKDSQSFLAEDAMRRACAIAAQQAERLAGEIERGEMEDPGAAEALRLFARLVRLSNHQSGPDVSP